jgi:hypothetical protein
MNFEKEVKVTLKLSRRLINHDLEVGKFIKNFDRVFDRELRARHSIHHHKRFEDVAIESDIPYRDYFNEPRG